jgi:hypothetical protein
MTIAPPINRNTPVTPAVFRKKAIKNPVKAALNRLHE